MLWLVCGSFLGLLVFAWDLLRVVVRGFFPLFFGFACISGLGFGGFFHVFWVGASSVVWVLWGFRLDVGFYGGFGC
jgi:hypothetical protein